MKRLTILFIVAALASPLAMISPAQAACSRPPGRSSTEGRAQIRSHPIIVYGALGSDVPRDAHGAYSVFVDVIRFYSGSDAQNRRRLEITNYADLDLPPGYEKPGNRQSIAASVDILRRFAGQRVVLFLVPGDDALGKDSAGRYKDQYATTSCTYNVVGDKDVPPLLRLLGSIFSQPAPTVTAVPTSGGENPTAIPTGSLGGVPIASPDEGDGRGGDVTRAGFLVVLVGLSLLLYRSTKSPLFERWRTSRAGPARP